MLNELNKDSTLLERLTGGIMEKLDQKREEYRSVWGEAKDENYKSPMSKKAVGVLDMNADQNNNFSRQISKFKGHNKSVSQHTIDRLQFSRNSNQQHTINEECDISFESKQQQSEVNQSMVSRPEMEGFPQPY